MTRQSLPEKRLSGARSGEDWVWYYFMRFALHTSWDVALGARVGFSLISLTVRTVERAKVDEFWGEFCPRELAKKPKAFTVFI